jgi:hypothetical protein
MFNSVLADAYSCPISCVGACHGFWCLFVRYELTGVNALRRAFFVVGLNIHQVIVDVVYLNI